MHKGVIDFVRLYIDYGGNRLCIRGRHGTIFQARPKFTFLLPVRPVVKTTFHLPVQPIGKITSHLPGRPSPFEKSPFICRPSLAHRKNHLSFASLAWPVGKIISHLPAWACAYLYHNLL